MKLLARIFAHALARRVAFVVVGLAFAFLASCFGEAHAQSSGSCEHTFPPDVSGGCASREDAYSAAAAAAAHNKSTRDGPTQTYAFCEISPVVSGPYTGIRFRIALNTCEGSLNAQLVTRYYLTANECPPGQSWNDETKTCFSCDINGPPLGPGHMQCAGATFDTCSYTVCSGGCGYDQPGGGHQGYVIDGTMWVLTTGWMPRGESCVVGPTPGLGTPPPDSDGDGTSDANDPSPNNPGSGGGGGQNGEGQSEDGSSSCGGPDQPACEADGSNSGSGNGNTSGGGGDCQSPPSSTGDAILAQIAYQAWATRCAVEGLGQGGTGTGPGTGDGDGAKEGTLKAMKDFLDGNGQSVPDADDPWMDGLPGEPSDWNLGLGGGSCPSPVSTSISLGGVTAPIEFSFQPMCDLAGLLNTLFKALGALIAAYIIAGVRR